MTRIRRGNYVFVTWVGDHDPPHVHIYDDRRLLVKWDLDKWQPINGEPTRRMVRLLEELVREGVL